MVKRSVWCTTEFVAFHQWLNAPLGVSYLRERHRHVFKVRVEVAVTALDRQVEFHNLKLDVDALLQTRTSTTLTLSCEALAEELAKELAPFYAVTQIDVSEDGECGGTVRFFVDA